MFIWIRRSQRSCLPKNVPQRGERRNRGNTYHRIGTERLEQAHFLSSASVCPPPLPRGDQRGVIRSAIKQIAIVGASPPSAGCFTGAQQYYATVLERHRDSRKSCRIESSSRIPDTRPTRSRQDCNRIADTGRLAGGFCVFDVCSARNRSTRLGSRQRSQ